jgi:solute carrier family 45 protein 1/2/4
MVHGAQWAGTPSVKGSTESMRMALLTASLIGLQYAPSYPVLDTR